MSIPRTFDTGQDVSDLEGILLLPQQDELGDDVLATHAPRAIRAFLDAMCDRLGDWHDDGKVDNRFLSPTEVGDYTKAKLHLGWEPKNRMKVLVEPMAKVDLAALRGSSGNRP